MTIKMVCVCVEYTVFIEKKSIFELHFETVSQREMKFSRSSKSLMSGQLESNWCVQEQ